MEQNIKKLPESLQPKGSGIPGLIATLIKRTDKVAWYLRNDGYHEVFLIKTGLTFDGSGLMEYYPGNNDFGKTAWCTRCADKAARYFADLSLGRPVNPRSSSERHQHINLTKKSKIRRPHTVVHNITPPSMRLNKVI